MSPIHLIPSSVANDLACSMGMRYIQLVNSYTGNADGSATLHVSQLAPNAALFVPGPALLYVFFPLPSCTLTDAMCTGSW